MTRANSGVTFKDLAPSGTGIARLLEFRRQYHRNRAKYTAQSAYCMLETRKVDNNNIRPLNVAVNASYVLLRRMFRN